MMIHKIGKNKFNKPINKPRKKNFSIFFLIFSSLITLPMPEGWSATPFHPDEISLQEMAKIKQAWRMQHFPQLTHKSGIKSNDDVSNFIQGPRILRDLETMEIEKLKSAQVTEQPWSDDYWPYYKGVLGARYADPEFNQHYEWKKLFDYISKHNAQSIFSSQDAKKIDLLSPSEKYELLMGDSQGTLTNFLWQQGKMYLDHEGKIETWMGICHGWAPASYMLKRPRKMVTVLAADGQTKINFYPSDIKALASLLWANTDTNTLFLGGRCNLKSPTRDDQGRIKEQECFDNNPGTFHMAVVNQVGLKKKSMVLDATYDYEVWNQPIISYSYEYFNPQTMKTVESLQEAQVLVKDFSTDKYKSYRHPKAHKVVGVAMELTYGVETAPTQDPTDSEENDGTNTVQYMYDVELDEQGKIIGGEWYHYQHPDFLWNPAEKAQALSYGDYHLLGEPLWKGEDKIPAHWKTPAIQSAKRGQPLAKVVESLINLANQ